MGADATRSVLIKLGAKLTASGKRTLGRARKDIGQISRLFGRALGGAKTLAIGAGVAFAAFIGKGVKDALGFNEAMAKVSTQVDTSKVNMADLTKEVLNLSRQTGKGPTDLAEALFQTLSAGVGAGDAMKFLTQSSKLAVAGFTKVNTVVDFGTSVMNAYGLKVDDMARISDLAFAAQKEGKTDIGQLAESMGDLLPFSAKMNLSLEDIFAATAALTKGGIKTSQAITFLKNVLAGVIAPTDQARKAAAGFGLDLSASAVKAQGLAGFLRDLKKATAGSDDAIGQIFPNLRGMIAATALAGGQSEDFEKILIALKDATGSTDEALDKIQAQGFFKFNKSLNELKIIGIEVGTKVIPPITAAIKAAIPPISFLAGKVGELADGFAGVREEGGKAESLLNAIGGGFRDVIDDPSKLLAGFGQIGKDIRGEFGRALEEIGGPLSDPFGIIEEQKRLEAQNSFGRGETEAARQRQLAGGTTPDFAVMAASRERLRRQLDARDTDSPIGQQIEDVTRGADDEVKRILEAASQRVDRRKREVDRFVTQQMDLAPI